MHVVPLLLTRVERPRLLKYAQLLQEDIKKINSNLARKRSQPNRNRPNAQPMGVHLHCFEIEVSLTCVRPCLSGLCDWWSWWRQLGCQILHFSGIPNASDSIFRQKLRTLWRESRGLAYCRSIRRSGSQDSITIEVDISWCRVLVRLSYSNPCRYGAEIVSRVIGN